MRLLWLAAILVATVGTAGAQEQVEVDAKIVLAVDVSRSMDLGEIAVQRDGYLAALRHPELAYAISAGARGKVAMAYFEWAGQIQDGTLVPWTVIDGPAAAEAFANEIDRVPIRRARGTSISRAIGFATILLEDETVAARRLVIDISGDGANNTGPVVTTARDEALAKGVTINGLPILAVNGAATPDLDLYYQDCVAGGDGAFVMVARRDADLAWTIRRKLILEISGLAVPRLVPARYEVTDCMVGEKSYRRWIRGSPAGAAEPGAGVSSR